MVTVQIKFKEMSTKVLIYIMLVFSLIIMISSFVMMFIEPMEVYLATMIFLSSAVSGTICVVVLDNINNPNSK